MNLNKTIYKFNYGGEHYEVDWLTDATCQKGEMVCDIFKGKGKEADCVGQIIVKKNDKKEIIKKMALSEIRDLDLD
jgi:hypothetical protein